MTQDIYTEALEVTVRGHTGHTWWTGRWSSGGSVDRCWWWPPSHRPQCPPAPGTCGPPSPGHRPATPRTPHIGHGHSYTKTVSMWNKSSKWLTSLMLCFC